MDKVQKVKEILKEAKDKGYISDVRQLVDLAKRLRGMDEDRLENLHKGIKTARAKI